MATTVHASAGRQAALAPQLYEAALAARRPKLRAHFDDGSVRRLPVGRWLGTATAGEEAVLARARGPVLDVGCGPGRHVLALAQRGVPALGLDLSPAAVALARERGAPARLGCVFGEVPEPGSWATALLLDGNLGIGGDPVALLRRLAELLTAEGEVLCELEPAGGPTGPARVRLEAGGVLSEPLPWGRVAWDGIGDAAQAAGLTVRERWSVRGRFFARLARRA